MWHAWVAPTVLTCGIVAATTPTDPSAYGALYSASGFRHTVVGLTWILEWVWPRRTEEDITWAQGGHSWHGSEWTWDLTPSDPKTHVLTTAGQAASRMRLLCAPDCLSAARFGMIMSDDNNCSSHLLSHSVCRALYFACMNAFALHTPPREVGTVSIPIYR